MIDFNTYLKEIEKGFQSKLATEHTYRPFLKTFVESFGEDVEAINEPKRRTFGAPDYVVRKREIPLGYIEAKDVGKDLDKLDKREKEQLKKYTDSLNNLIYTNYLDFRWYVRGEVVANISLAEFDAIGRLQPKADAEIKLTNLIKEFLQKEVPTVATPKELAKRMASITRLIRQTIEKALEDEETTNQQTLHDQFESFRKTLLPNLDEKGFADLYSQTIAYGLFTARCFDKEPPFTRQEAAYLVPKTNPFLRDTFDRIAGIHLDERIVWAVDDLAELLNRTDIAAILQDFGKRTRQEDPVVHFYETFLSEYDPKLRETRGVYYTPEPVVSYIVRSVDKILQNDFGLPKGLADSSKLEDGSHRVLILDPATGTGTFLYNVIKQIYKRYEKNKGMWDGYVSQHLLPRIFGFELLVAPYAVAHLKLGLLLEETGYKFDTDERLRIYLNNTLDFTTLKEDADAFSAFINNEAKAGREIQQDKPVMVILGNPPYSGHSANTGRWIADLLRGSDSLNQKATDSYFMVDGQPLGEANSKWLNNDYVKFIRFSQWRIDQTGYGILSFITSNSYLDSPTFRGMRESLLKSFDEIYILDLHGNTNKKETDEDGSKDENVFDIIEGVSIGIFIKKQSNVNQESNKIAKIFHAHLYGVREKWTVNLNNEKELSGGKYHWLSQNDIRTTKWTELNPNSPFYLFIPQDETLRDEYDSFWKITDAMPLNGTGIITKRDNLTIQFDAESIWKTVQDFVDFPEDKVRTHFALPKDVRDWTVKWAKKDLVESGLTKSKVKPILYRPFDIRYTYYTGKSRGFIGWTVERIMSHLTNKGNLGLITSRQHSVNSIWSLIGVTKYLSESCAISNKTKEINYFFPLYIYTAEKNGLFGEEANERKPNFSDEFILEFSRKLKINFAYETESKIYMAKEGENSYASIPKTDKLKVIYEKSSLLRPEDIFNYAYAVFHSPTYRSRYSEFLKIDFPRLPLTSNVSLFSELAAFGSRLIELHLLEKDIESDVTFPEKGSNEVEMALYKVISEEGWIDDAGELHTERFGEVWINKTQYFDNVPETAWNFHIGGYQVLQKWLKDRKGRTLSFDDLEHYSKVVSALSQTIELMQKIDETIEENGGFPIV